MIDQWPHCYVGGWRGKIVPEAFAHPAKIAPALSDRIYRHAIECFGVRARDTVIDPFGGIAGTALGAMANGLRWIGCELEEKFVKLGNENLLGFARQLPPMDYRHWPLLIQGDSRKLRANIGEYLQAQCVVSSPPYSGISVEKNSNGVDRTRQYESYRASGGGQSFEAFCATQEKHSAGYGQSPGQLSAMPAGQAPSLVISSPPYAGIATGAGGLNTKPGAEGQQSGRSASAPSQATDQRYGSSAGQLAVMPEGVAAVVSSPPYEGMEVPPGNAGNRMNKETWCSGSSLTVCRDYGSTEGQIGVQSGETFWAAAADIVAECYALLKPGGVAIWVTKDYVRKGKRVAFGDHWQALCESRGFVLSCRHRAMLVEHHGEQDDLFGGAKQLQTSRKSFFRRMAENKGSPAIDWEDVICVRKPA